VIQCAIAGTVLFTIVSVVEVIVQSWTRPVAVALDLGLFAIGCTTFLGAYAIAIGRSRTEEIGVASLYLLTNRVAPNPVRVRLLVPFAVQCVVAITVASVRPFTAAAFAVLVPMYGLGLNGVWAARHGTFGPRIRPAPPTTDADDEAEADATGHAVADDTSDAAQDPTDGAHDPTDGAHEDGDAAPDDASDAAEPAAGENDAPEATEMEQNARHG
jgi:hypothetical protein